MKLKFLVFFITFLSFEIIVVEAKSADTIRGDLRNAKNRIMKAITGDNSYTTEEKTKEIVKTKASKKECIKSEPRVTIRQDLACAK